MSKRILVVDAAVASTSTEKPPIYWNLCILCQQEKKNEKLLNPAMNRNRRAKECGYQTLSQNLLLFNEIGNVPFNIRLSELQSDESSLYELLIKNRARWHKSCYSLCNTQKLGRVKNKNTKKIPDTPVKSPVSPVKTRGKGHYDINQDVGVEKCYFCNKYDKETNLHKASTHNIDKKVRLMATQLQDARLLAKLSLGDMFAVDAFYHLSCLTILHNRYRSSQCASKADSRRESIHSLVFGELVGYIEERRYEEGFIPLFKLSDLTKMYCNRLSQIDPEIAQYIHPTRLKNKLLEHVQGLRAQQHGKQVLMMFDEDIGETIDMAMSHVTHHDAINLVRAAQIIRKDLEKVRCDFDGSFKESNVDLVPETLRTLINMILGGPNIKDQSCTNANRRNIADNIAQLIIFNYSKRVSSNENTVIRHSTERQTPLTIYLSLMFYAQTRNRGIIDKLHKLGLGISYDGLLNMTTAVSNAVCTQYSEEGVVCPLNLQKGLFLVGAVDNIDHNTTSTTSKNSFHGTAISLVQFPGDTPGNMNRYCRKIQKGQRSAVSLPRFYTQVNPVIAVSDPNVPPSQFSVDISDCLPTNLGDQQTEWLHEVRALLDKDELSDEEFISWAAFHASKNSRYIPVSTSALLPLFHENANSEAMMLHSMNVISNAIKHLNPQQVPVFSCDQPLFAISKYLQWKFPATHGEENIVIMMGGLHIEMNFVKLLGDWLTGSGWTSALVQADITTTGRADAILKCSHLTRSRYAHQVTAATLSTLCHTAYESYSKLNPNKLTFSEWCEHESREHPQFKYWYTTLDLQLIMLRFVFSIRTGDFTLYVKVLQEMVVWLFALDHTNYSRWLPVHIRDMIMLEKMHPSIYKEFIEGHFAVHKSSNIFSLIAIDQAHEQMNRLIKGSAGAVGLFDNPQAFQRWMVAGPEVTRMLVEYETYISDDDVQITSSHHEMVPCFQKRFQKDVKALQVVFQDIGNPFRDDSKELYTLDTKAVVADSTAQELYTIWEIGSKQYQTFCYERLKIASKPLSDTIKKNQFKIFRLPSSRLMKKSQAELSSLKADCSLFSRLYISCQVRAGDLEEFFCHENRPCPPSISDMGQLRQGKKSDLVEILERDLVQEQTTPQVQVKLYDGATLVHMLAPKGQKTFKDYATNIFCAYLLSQLASVDRIDVVWDRYFENSLKHGVRMIRGQGVGSVRKLILPDTPIPMNWGNFLRLDKNKDELFRLLALEIQGMDTGQKAIISTLHETIITSNDEIQHDELSPCDHEEADTRLIFHAKHCGKVGLKKVLIRSVDTDVVVLAVAFFEKLMLDELWIAFGVRKHYRYIPIHKICAELGSKKSNTLPMFHALSGCDTVSFFNGKGKRSAWEAWELYASVTDAFSELCERPDSVNENVLHVIERFIIIMYCKTCSSDSVNAARKKLFGHGSRDIEHIPSTQAALLQHIKRAVYQAGYVWGQSLIANPILPDPSEWGWVSINSIWQPYWTNISEAAKFCSELIHCGCKVACKYRCKCKNAQLECTELCYCQGACGNKNDQ